MDESCRVKKLKYAWKILEQEYLKPINNRNENQIEHAVYVLNLYAREDELSRWVAFDKDYIDAPYSYPNSKKILEYVNKMLSITKKQGIRQHPDNIANIEDAMEKRALEFFIPEPEMEHVREAFRDYFAVAQYLSVPEIIENISKVIAGRGEFSNLKKMLDVVFKVYTNPEDPRLGQFDNDVFAKRLWDSLTMIQKQWLIKKGMVEKRIISLIDAIK